MTIIIILIIAAVVAIYIALPFFLKRNEQEAISLEAGSKSEDPILEKIKSLNTQKDNLYTAIKDIEFDYGLGKLSKEDFEELNVKYKNEAASVLREIDAVEKEGGVQTLDSELEKEILAFRKSSSKTDIDVDIENEISAFRASNQYCPSCGAVVNTQDLFCSKCGAQLKK